MAQLTIRIDDDLAAQIKTHADGLGRSVNGWVGAVLRTALDPEFADTDVERTRGKLARAGLLVVVPPRPGLIEPDPQRLAEARRAAGSGTPLSTIVSDERG
jgi:plasmid stability protein